MVPGSESWAPALSTKLSGFIFANILPRLMESFIEIIKS